MMAQEGSPGELQPCPLQFFDFRQLDHRENCPIYSTILETPGGVSVDELDSLQNDLLALQTNVQNRVHLLEAELGVLTDWQVKRVDYRRRKHSDTSDSGHMKGRKGNDPTLPPPAKRQRSEDHVHKKSKQHKSQKQSQAVPMAPEAVAEGDKGMPSEKSSVPKMKGDAPDRFWASVEPYFADITEADIRMLQQSEEEDTDLYVVPPLGQHYAHGWAMEDMQDEQRESSRLMQIAEPGNIMSGDSMWSDDPDALLKQTDPAQDPGGEGKGRYGPLTQRLISAFLEDPLVAKVPTPRPHPQWSSPPISLAHTDTLERRIREELVSLGIFEPGESKSEEEQEDEIMAELQRKQAELRAVSEYNREQREVLVAMARAEMRRQEIRQQLEQANADVMEWLKRCTQKKKGISRKEREAAWKALELRDSLRQRLAH